MCFTSSREMLTVFAGPYAESLISMSSLLKLPGIAVMAKIPPSISSEKGFISVLYPSPNAFAKSSFNSATV